MRATPRTSSTRRRLSLAAVGLAAAAAVGVPTAAYASSPAASTAAPASSAPANPTQCSPAQRWSALAVAAPKVADYLNAHPDVNTELQHLRTLPKDQRRTEARAYLSANPDVKTALKDAHSAVAQFRKGCHK
jgi:hemophore-related protein